MSNINYDGPGNILLHDEENINKDLKDTIDNARLRSSNVIGLINYYSSRNKELVMEHEI